LLDVTQSFKEFKEDSPKNSRKMSEGVQAMSFKTQSKNTTIKITKTDDSAEKTSSIKGESAFDNKGINHLGSMNVEMPILGNKDQLLEEDSSPKNGDFDSPFKIQPRRMESSNKRSDSAKMKREPKKDHTGVGISKFSAKDHDTLKVQNSRLSRLTN
jgi:hypothetical protein